MKQAGLKRREALAWWKGLSEEQKDKVAKLYKEDRSANSFTGREIEKFYVGLEPQIKFNAFVWETIQSALENDSKELPF